MTQNHHAALISETIRALQRGAPITKELVLILLKPWPDLYRNAIAREARTGSICFRPPPGSNSTRMTKAVLVAAPRALRPANAGSPQRGQTLKINYGKSSAEPGSILRRRPVLACRLPAQVAEVPAPLAERQITAVAGAELVEHVIEGGAPDPRRLVVARGGEELAVRAERHHVDPVIVGDAGAGSKPRGPLTAPRNQP